MPRRPLSGRTSGSSNLRSRSTSLPMVLAGAFCLISFSLFPILVLESLDRSSSSASSSSSNIASVQKAVQQGQTRDLPNKKFSSTRKTKDGRELPEIGLMDFDTTPDRSFSELPVARGVAGRKLEQTPAMIGAKRAHIECDVNVDSLAYWNDPIGTRDREFVSPFASEGYISFAPDRGGWNNVRMSMEIIFVIAAATGRTLVLPPKEPMYLMHHDKENRYRGFADFFPITKPEFQKRVRVISFEDFLKVAEDDPDLTPSSTTLADKVQAAADHCDLRNNSPANCNPVFEYLEEVGYSPQFSAMHTCLIFDVDKYNGKEISKEHQEFVETICGPKRDAHFWNANEMNSHKLIHFRASDKKYRLLTHFYNMIHFTEPSIDHYFKRFVRDFLHYHDAIYCAAGKIVHSLRVEGQARGFKADTEGTGAYSALHVRRGDLQYKKVKIPAAEWYNNTKEVWHPGEILYIATDERDKSFFDDIAKHHDLRFLDDYWDLAGLGNLDPNYMGMVDTIVASRGRAFAGTWFSTFSGYINRLRGYHGISMMDSWYSFLPKKTAVHEWKVMDDFAYAFEWPDGWVGIDADEWPSRDEF